MKIEIVDRSLMLILLLEECNFNCAHCIREDEPMEPDYRLSFEQLGLCLSDCRSLESIRWVHFSGGEPTLWTEEDRDLVDLLLEIANAGFTPGFTTNGSHFDDYVKCGNFFARYVGGSTMSLRVYLSIDSFHGNFDRKRGRAPSLDNIVRCKQELLPTKANLLVITVLATVSKDPKSLLPDEMIEYYESAGISFGFVPLLPHGRAKSFSHLCPDLSSDNPENLGAYSRFHRKGSWEKRYETGGRDSASHINLIGDDYYFTDPWRRVGKLEHLPDTIVQAYSEA
jgi:MoaA/NifB/PqqE/SkfB family radical SAM enzyme